VRRGCTQIRVEGEEAERVLRDALLAAGEGLAPEEFCRRYAAPDRDSVRQLLDMLAARRILVPEDSDLLPEAEESALDVFYWHFGVGGASMARRMAEKRTAILGVNCISRRLALSLADCGVERVEVVDHPLLRNLRLFREDGSLEEDAWHRAPVPLPYEAWADGSAGVECLVATCDFGDQQIMRDLNRFCLAEGLPFLPVVLQDIIGYVGPLVVPGETACFECLRGRQNSHLEDPELARLPEAVAFHGQAVNGFHPSMASVLGDIAAVELTKFYGGVLPGRRAGCLVEVNLFNHHLVARKVLKVPRCPACSALNTRPPASPDWNVYMPGNPVSADRPLRS
jgi:bacteriocin biosynthesis cyclodehydratase domain-containing protein